MKNVSLAFLLILIIIIYFIEDSNQLKNILIVMLYDGFQNNYLERGLTPTLNNFKYNGVTSDYIRTVYPAIMKTSVHTIASGQGVKSHFRYHRNYTDISESATNVHNIKLDSISQEYIWGLNELNGGTSLCICWPEYNPEDLKNCKDSGLGQTATLRDRADKMIEWLNKTDEAEVPNLVMFYVDKLDKITHFFGPLSRNSSLFIRRLDLLTKYILNKLMEINVYHRANIFILSDHGMRAVMDRTNVVIKEIDREFGYTPRSEPGSDSVMDVNGLYYLDNNMEDIQGYIMNVEDFTKLGKLHNQFTVVRTPSSVDDSISIIEYAACPGFVLSLEQWKYNRWYENISPLLPPHSKDGPMGVHGYLRQNDAIFMAKGPSLARFKVVDPFKMEDFFCAFAKLLHIQGDFEKDGNFSRIRPIFVEAKQINWIEILMTIIGLAVGTCFIFYFLVKFLVDTSTLK